MHWWEKNYKVPDLRRSATPHTRWPDVSKNAAHWESAFTDLAWETVLGEGILFNHNSQTQ